MRSNSKSFMRSAIRDESGVTMIWTLMLLPLILGVGGLGVDAGYAYIGYRELQILSLIHI